MCVVVRFVLLCVTGSHEVLDVETGARADEGRTDCSNEFPVPARTRVGQISATSSRVLRPHSSRAGLRGLAVVLPVRWDIDETLQCEEVDSRGFLAVHACRILWTPSCTT